MSNTSSSSTESPRQWKVSETILNKQEFDEKIARKASEWFVILMAGDTSERDHQNFRQWLEADPRNKGAWDHIERVNSRIQGVPSQLAHRTLGEPVSRARRRNLQALAFFVTVGGAGLLTYRQSSDWSADYRTATGEIRTINLDDGTQLVLNAGSAIDVSFNASERLIRLVSGEVVITTGHKATDTGAEEKRPFFVLTSDGRIRALGTRFSVNRYGNRSEVAVFDGAVEITPEASQSPSRIFNAGRAASFDRSSVLSEDDANEKLTAWTDGLIVADGRTLADFVIELNRYRPGYLRCSPSAAKLRVSGVFRLHDTDGILSSLADALPIRIRYFTPYLVNIEAT